MGRLGGTAVKASLPVPQLDFDDNNENDAVDNDPIVLTNTFGGALRGRGLQRGPTRGALGGRARVNLEKPLGDDNNEESNAISGIPAFIGGGNAGISTNMGAPFKRNVPERIIPAPSVAIKEVKLFLVRFEREEV